MTHAELVKRATKWLWQKHPVIVSEMAGGGPEEPDAIGFRMGFSTLIECKTSRSDYYADRKKPSTRMGDFRYFMTPPDLLAGLVLTDGWGLLEVHGKVVMKVKDAPQIEEKDWRGEQALLLSCFRRMGKPDPESCVAVKFYTFIGPSAVGRKATLGVARGVYAGDRPVEGR